MSTVIRLCISGDKAIRTIRRDGKTYMIATDVSKLLRIRNAHDFFKGADGIMVKMNTHGGSQNLKAVDQTTVLKAIFKSRKIPKDVIDHLAEKVVDTTRVAEALSDFEIPDDLPDMYVYAIRERESGNIKLGISRDPQKRMKQLQTGNSQELELVAVRKADNRFKDERQLHIENNASHIHGEWFMPEAVDAIK